MSVLNSVVSELNEAMDEALTRMFEYMEESEMRELAKSEGTNAIERAAIDYAKFYVESFK